MANILVVEDYEDTAESMAIWLKLYGHEVHIARNGYQAIEIARREAAEIRAARHRSARPGRL